MKRILNFVVILLTTLSIVNAVNIPLRKRAVAFAACPSGSSQFIAASIDPDPPVPGETAIVRFSITLPITFESGKIATDATDGGGESLDGFPTDEDVCDIEGIKCPIVAGSTVDFETPVPIPDDAPDTYNLEYSLVDGTGKEIACSSGPVTGAAKAKGDDGKAPPGPAAPGPGPDGDPDDGGPGPKGGDPDDGGPGPKGGDPDDGGPGPKGGDPDDGDAKVPAKGPGPAKDPAGGKGPGTPP